VSTLRIGSGFDAHRLVPDRALWLGCTRVPFARGLLGHSDGDCLAHAVCDALLGAAGLGDLGAHFPSTDERWRDAPSRVFLEETVRRVAQAGFSLVNVDATVVAEAPVLAPHLPAMRDALAEALGVSPGVVSVKAKSSDGLGAVGRGEGIAALAAVLLSSRS
jgi:2-C-methyl-D-erythritol 2,4-cyclodiphosphate synthase